MKPRNFLLGAASALLFAGAANAGILTGQTVQVNLSVPDSGDFGTQTVLVGPGFDGNFFGNTFFDLDGGANGDEFIYSSDSDFCGIIACNASYRATWTLSGLSIPGGLLSFTILQQDVAPISVDALTSTSVKFSYADISIHQGVNVIGQFNGGGAVPEPAAWALMIGGFGFAGATLRRRKAVAA